MGREEIGLPNKEREEKRQTFPEIRKGTKGLCVLFCSGADRPKREKNPFSLPLSSLDCQCQGHFRLLPFFGE